jgi:1-acyl-sn-glycerol-3-phosphate acyltransferase
MAQFFSTVYHFFKTRRWLFFALLLALSCFILYYSTQIHLEEDIAKVASKKEQLSREEYVIRNFSFAEKIVIHVRVADSGSPLEPDTLAGLALQLQNQLREQIDTTLARSIVARIDDSLPGLLSSLVFSHLPLFLDRDDLIIIDSLIQPALIRSRLEKNYRILSTPAGIVMKQQLLADPLGITAPALKKLQSLQVGDNFVLRDGFIFTSDFRHVLLFITPSSHAVETRYNALLVQYIEEVIKGLGKTRPEIKIDYFGAPVVAAGNADRIKKDIILTLSIALLVILLFIGWYFRNPVIPFLGFFPAFFGGGFALAILFLIKGTISAIALGIGSVILGLIIDYALYMINHFRKKSNLEVVIRDLAQTIVVCALTSIGAFLCLTQLDSAVLHDLGWFAALSIAGSALFALVILPQFMGNWVLAGLSAVQQRTTLIGRFAEFISTYKIWIAAALVIAGIISLFFLHRTTFETNMESLNYMSDDLRNAEKGLAQISDATQKKVFVVSTGATLQAALQSNDTVMQHLALLSKAGSLTGYSGVPGFLLSGRMQQERLKQWYEFWNPERRQHLMDEVLQTGSKIGFSPGAFEGLKEMLSKEYISLPDSIISRLKDLFAVEWIRESPQMTLITAVARVPEEGKHTVYEQFAGNNGIVLFDRQDLTDRFVEQVRTDFNLLVTLSMIFVSLLLLISFGRIEITLTTALPMFLSWLITLGFMGLTGIRFNIFNIIISSFVFGLGVDYSILMMRGLLNEYKTGIRDMETYHISILLSSATTIFGVAALFAARHPALQSIALISVIGIVSVVMISLTCQSLLAHWFLLRPKEKRTFPVTLYITWFSLFISWIPISTIALIMVIYGVIISPLLPLPRKKKQLIFHYMFCLLSKLYISMNFLRFHRIENTTGETFKRPAIIIANHQSLIETPAMLRLYPKIVILTNEWVFRHWIFGPVARLAGFIPISHGVDNSLHLMKQKLSEGYSILIFPEGTRSRDGHIQRFHRGAFYIAEKLQTDILPVLIFGSGEFLCKGNFWGKSSRLFMKILPRITPEDDRFGVTYQERTKGVRRYYRDEFRSYKEMKGTPSFYRYTLRLNYLFKGPVLEWYVRIKLMLEQDFRLYHELLPLKGEIYDLGCGFGYITSMLMLTSEDRILTGVDFDPEKITVAQNGYLNNDRIRFIHGDASEYPLTPCDGILLGDLLHYLPPVKQDDLLHSCMDNLKPGGVLLIREGNADLALRHKRTRLTEFFSTRILHFNKTQDESRKLWFVSAEAIRAMAESNGFTFDVIDKGKRSSNVFMVIRRNIG